MQGGQGCQPRRLAFRVRITSYNVCYTKLLRTAVEYAVVLALIALGVILFLSREGGFVKPPFDLVAEQISPGA